jgi:hypothetical protein
MTARKILGLFDSEAAAFAAVEALNRAGFRDHTVSRGVDDASGLAGAASRPLDEGRVTVAPRRGRVLLTVRGEDAEIGRIEEILKQQGALDAVAGQAAPEAAPREPTTLSGAPADHGASAGVLPETPMPTGSGVMGSRGEWLVEREGKLAEDVDPEAAERDRREREIKERS